MTALCKPGTVAITAPSRRGFLKTMGVLVVGFSAAGQTRKLWAQSPTNPTGLVDVTKVDSWVTIADDESVTVYSGKCDFGQGFATVQYQLAADELYVPLNLVTLIYCNTGITPDQGVTSGSQSHIVEFGPGGLRQALATARGTLFKLASNWLDVPTAQLTVQNGVISVIGMPTRQVTYGQLLFGQRFNVSLDSNAIERNPATYTFLGTSVPRVDIPSKATGVYRYTHNISVPGMLHGRVVRSPVVGANLVSVDPTSVAGLPGNVQVVVRNNFVGVVADTQWHAIQAAKSLTATWSSGAALPDQASLYTWITQQPSADSLTVDSGDTAATISGSTSTVSAQYLWLYLMHGAIAGSCAVADVRGGTGTNASAKIWSHTQGVYPMRDSVALVLGIPNTNVEVIFVEGSGCYGLSGSDSVSFDAAIMSQSVGKPVRVQYSRSDEMTAGESYGPAYVINLHAGLDTSSRIKAWSYEGWSLAKGNRPNATTPGNILSGALVGFPVPPLIPGAATPPAKFSNNNNSACNYVTGVVGGNPPGGTGTVASQKVLSHVVASPFFTGPLRSPDRLQNTFANECFMDELAAAAGADPVQFRLRHLSDPRLIAVVNAGASAANWNPRPYPQGLNAFSDFGLPVGVKAGRGFACVLYEGDNGYTAMAVEILVDIATGIVTVTKITTAVETGPISSPDGLKNQTEGGALQGMSRALYEQLEWNAVDGTITTKDWVTYPAFAWGQQIPVMNTVLIDNLTVSPTGAGELSITLTAAAIGNAIFDATAVRIRQAPFTPSTVLAALAAANVH
jgi:nicotinate dehydrogenase subunit B